MNRVEDNTKSNKKQYVKYNRNQYESINQNAEYQIISTSLVIVDLLTLKCPILQFNLPVIKFAVCECNYYHFKYTSTMYYISLDFLNDIYY